MNNRQRNVVIKEMKKISLNRLFIESIQIYSYYRRVKEQNMKKEFYD